MTTTLNSEEEDASSASTSNEAYLSACYLYRARWWRFSWGLRPGVRGKAVSDYSDEMKLCFPMKSKL